MPRTRGRKPALLITAAPQTRNSKRLDLLCLSPAHLLVRVLCIALLPSLWVTFAGHEHNMVLRSLWRRPAHVLRHLIQYNCFQWNVNGYFRVGFFASRHIRAGDEVTFDYQYDRGDDAQECYCGSEDCRGKILGKKAAGRSSSGGKPRGRHISPVEKVIAPAITSKLTCMCTGAELLLPM